MATITPSSWTVSNPSSTTMPVSISQTSVSWGRTPREQVGYNKAYVTIDTNKYKSITLNYGAGWQTGENTTIQFGVFNNNTYDSESGTSKILTRNEKGSATINFFNSNNERIISGEKYMGFFFWGNGWILNSEGYYEAEGTKPITSITAVLATYTLTYNANGGSGAPSKVSNITSTNIASTVPIRQNYDFLGWNTSSSASTATYVAGDKITLSKDTTLYAVWKGKSYIVTFNANGGTTSTASKSVTYNSTYGTLPTPSKPGYTFNGWFTATSGGTKIISSSTYSTSGNQTLYAQWTVNKYTVTLNPNSGTVSPTSLTVTYDSTYGTLPTPTRPKYRFLGWFTAATGGTQVTSSTKYTTAGNSTLYAHWELEGTVRIFINGEYKMAQVYTYKDTAWYQTIPYAQISSEWKICGS